MYVVTWILLGQNSEENVDESAKKQFTVGDSREFQSVDSKVKPLDNERLHNEQYSLPQFK